MNSPLPPPTTAPRIGRGDRWFNEEVAPHGDRLKAYLHAKYPSVRDVDDVVQESFVKIWKARAAGRIDSAKAFLFRIATNLCVDAVRKSARSATETIGDWSTIRVLHESATPAEALAAREKLRIFTEAMVALPNRCREVVLLCKFEGVSHAQAAERLGVSSRTIDAHLRAGMERLGSELRKRGLEGIES